MTNHWKTAELPDRVWWAYQCLPRDDLGRLPAYRELERQATPKPLANNAIRKWLFPVTTLNPSADKARKMAQILNTTASWLLTGEGDAPKTDQPTAPRPRHPQAKGPPRSSRRPSTAPVIQLRPRKRRA